VVPRLTLTTVILPKPADGSRHWSRVGGVGGGSAGGDADAPSGGAGGHARVAKPSALERPGLEVIWPGSDAASAGAGILIDASVGAGEEEEGGKSGEGRRLRSIIWNPE